jgi:hypothetical protein
MAIIGVRMGKSIGTKRSPDIIEIVVETIDDLGKIQNITDLLSKRPDSLETVTFVQCMDRLIFLSPSYPSGVEDCYNQALDGLNNIGSAYYEILLKLKEPLDEMKDNHYFIIGLNKIAGAGRIIDYDSAWSAHHKKPSQLDMAYKPLLRNLFEARVETMKYLDGTERRFKEIESLMNNN